MKYILDGDPVAWARAGINGGRLYDTQKHLKLIMGLNIRNQHGDRPFFEGPLILEVTFFMPIPKRVKNRSLLEGQPTKSKPDCSNLVKLIEDSCIGLLYKDDAIIYKIVAQRVYGQRPRTEFIFREAE